MSGFEFNLWDPGFQPDILNNKDSFGNIEWTYADIIENIYEALRKEFPNYINRKIIGRDSSGQYDIFAYEFCPPHYQKTIYIQSGVHCLETEGYFGLARLMYLICHDFDERLTEMKSKIRFLVVPCVSVYGVSKKGTIENIMSCERYAIPNSIYGINPNRDFYDLKCEETRAVRSYVAENSDKISVCFDFHTTTMPDWNAYLLIWPDGMKDNLTVSHENINNMLYEKNKPEFKKAFMGPESKYPTDAIKGSFTGGFFNEFNINSYTVEHSDYVFDKKLGTSKAMTKAVELYGNHVLFEAGC